MSGLSEVSILIGQRARDIEKAREIFTAEIRAFVGGILAGVRRIRTEPWTTSRVRLDLPRDIDTEAKAASDFSSQYAVARATLRFKKGTNFRQIADIRFGIEFDESADLFAWQATLVPAASYNRVDDVVRRTAVIPDDVMVLAISRRGSIPDGRSPLRSGDPAHRIQRPHGLISSTRMRRSAGRISKLKCRRKFIPSSPSMPS